MKPWPWLLIILILGSLLAPVSAQEIYVNNRAFKGESSGSGPSMYLELAPLAKMLKLDVQVEDGQHSVNSQALRVQVSGDKTLVLLDSLAEAAGLRVDRNASMNTVDIRRRPKRSASATASSEPSGDWGNQKAVNSGVSSATTGAASNTPEDAVNDYFTTIARLSKQLDFTKDADFDTYLEANQAMVVRESMEEHTRLIRDIQKKGMGPMFDEQFAAISSTKAKVLNAKVKGNKAKVKTRLTIRFGGKAKTNVEVFECQLEDGRWKIDPQF